MHTHKQTVAQFEVSTQTSGVKPFIEPFRDKKPIFKKRPTNGTRQLSRRVNGINPLGDSWRLTDAELLSQLVKLRELEPWQLPTETNGFELFGNKKPLTNKKPPTNKIPLTKKNHPTDAKLVSRQPNGVEPFIDKNPPVIKRHPTSGELLSQLVSLQSEQTKSVGTIKSILMFFVLLSLIGVGSLIFLGRVYYAFMP